jgi:N-acetylneuraminate synthase
MDPKTWKEMVDRTRELENAIGNDIKSIEKNEKETVVLQRRSIRLALDLPLGTEIQLKHLEVLRPCPPDSIAPYEIKKIIGKKLCNAKLRGEHLRWSDLK